MVYLVNLDLLGKERRLILLKRVSLFLLLDSDRICRKEEKEKKILQI